MPVMEKGIAKTGRLIAPAFHDAKYALCENHINYTFVTDHSEHVSETDYDKLLLNEDGDTLLQNGAGKNVGTVVHCADGFGATMVPGLEGQLLALGMEDHTSTDVATRQATYGADDAAAKTTLESCKCSRCDSAHGKSRNECVDRAQSIRD